MTTELNKNATPNKAAIRRMITSFPVIHKRATIAEVEKSILKNIRNLDTINYIYVIDDANKLVGVISIKELFRSEPATTIASLMKKDLVTIRPHTKQERAASLAIKHSLKAVPIVDKNDVLLGIVPSDEILRILDEENTEDFLRSAGIHDLISIKTDFFNAPISLHIKKRLPWLILGLIGGLIAAAVVGFFEATLKKTLILAAFMPALVYIADAVGAQSQTIFIRTLSVNPEFNIKKYLIREVGVGLSLAVILSLMVATATYFIWFLPLLSLVLGVSFFATILAAIIIAIALPWFFNSINIDPAIASGPFATIIRDVLSVFIYLTIAMILL